MSDSHNDLWGSFKEGFLKACNEACGYKENRKCNVNTWWWYSGAKNKIQMSKEAHTEKKNPTKETQNEYWR